MCRSAVLCVLLALAVCGCDEKETACTSDANVPGTSSDCKECEACLACDQPCPACEKCPECEKCPACDDPGSEGGECENYALKCEDTDNGSVIYQCVRGAWTEHSKCPNGVSCHDGACGECRNADIRCEDRYVEDVADTACEVDESGDVSVLRCNQKIGAIVGVILTCRNGVWDDKTDGGEINVCPSHGKDYYEGQINASDYLHHYGPMVRLNHVSCTADGKSCGECNNVFWMCNDEEKPDGIWHCNYGELERSMTCPSSCTTLLHCIFSLTDG
ncbi:MAG: hypothetical protein IKY83_14215 [Proteobacteria bacterium]|nr:hypothetical protein [Pseudomonadota bacterium]